MRILMSLMVVFFFAGQAVAGDDPCENESGAAYGLCNAYCEAMDCGSNDTLASGAACERVKANYSKLTSSETMPCDAECPFDVYFLNNTDTRIEVTDCWAYPYEPAGIEQCMAVEVYFNDEGLYSGVVHLGPDAHVYFGPWSVYFGTESVYYLTKGEAQKCWAIIEESELNSLLFPY